VDCASNVEALRKDVGMGDRESADPHGRGNYTEGSANLEARAALVSCGKRQHDGAPTSKDWFLDLVEWGEAEVAADVGCGSGRYLASLARRAQLAIGLDLSLAMLNEVAARSSERAPTC
jgi:SAM-dependent methyltransferase